MGSSHEGAFQKHLLLLLPFVWFVLMSDEAHMQVFVLKGIDRKHTCIAGAPAA